MSSGPCIFLVVLACISYIDACCPRRSPRPEEDVAYVIYLATELCLYVPHRWLPHARLGSPMRPSSALTPSTWGFTRHSASHQNANDQERSSWGARGGAEEMVGDRMGPGRVYLVGVDGALYLRTVSDRMCIRVRLSTCICV